MIRQTGTPAEINVQTPLVPQMLPPADPVLFLRRASRLRGQNCGRSDSMDTSLTPI
jgi:hypothetical protein